VFRGIGRLYCFCNEPPLCAERLHNTARIVTLRTAGGRRPSCGVEATYSYNPQPPHSPGTRRISGAPSPTARQPSPAYRKREAGDNPRTNQQSAGCRCRRDGVCEQPINSAYHFCQCEYTDVIILRPVVNALPDKQQKSRRVYFFPFPKQRRRL
jgi:hypothetical protein